MGEKSDGFRRQYEDALQTLESEDTEIFTLVAGDATGECSVVLGNNWNVEKPQDYVDMLATGVVSVSAMGEGDKRDVLRALEERLGVGR